MLTKEDLQQIGSLMDERTEVILTAVKVGFDAVDHRFERIEGRMDGLEGKVDGLEGRMVTKDDLERALDRFEVRITERFDHRYVRR